jgi:hypothetical protein
MVSYNARRATAELILFMQFVKYMTTYIDAGITYKTV